MKTAKPQSSSKVQESANLHFSKIADLLEWHVGFLASSMIQLS